MWFSLFKKKRKIHVKNAGQPDPQPDRPEPLFNPLKMTSLTCNPIDLIQT